VCSRRDLSAACSFFVNVPAIIAAFVFHLYCIFSCKESGRTGERKEKAKIREDHRDMTGQREADTDEKVHEDEVHHEVGEDEEYETRRVLHLRQRKLAK